MIDEHIPQEDLALYAMQALPETEAAGICTHLASCAACRDDLAALFGDMAMFAASVEQYPLPQGARQRFLDRISATAQEKPAAQLSAHPIAAKKQTGTIHPWRVRIAWASAAMLAATVLLLGLNIDSLHRQLQNDAQQMAALAAQSSRAQRVLDLLTSNSAQHVLLTANKTPAEPTGRAVYLADRGALIFQANNLKPLPEDRTYELWVIPANGAAPIPAGLFRPDAAGSASVVLPQIPSGVPAKAFGVTVERAEGSTTPTAPIILAGAASGA